MFLVSSCSGNKKYNRNIRDHKSTQNDQDYKEVTQEEKILEHYRQLRLKNWDDYVKKKPLKSRRSARPNATKVNILRPKDEKPALNPKPELSEEKIRDINIEISQRKNYFCLKFGEHKKFSNETECQVFVENTHLDCQQKYDESPKEILSCLRYSLQNF